MKKSIEKRGFKFKFNENACLGCKGNCCIGGSGYIWVSEDEQKLISSLLGIAIYDFRRDYLRLHNGRYTIKEIKINGSYYCVFFCMEKKRCSIYSARPEQCRTFPFWEYYKDKINLLMDECPGIELI